MDSFSLGNEVDLSTVGSENKALPGFLRKSKAKEFFKNAGTKESPALPSHPGLQWWEARQRLAHPLSAWMVPEFPCSAPVLGVADGQVWQRPVVTESGNSRGRSHQLPLGLSPG